MRDHGGTDAAEHRAGAVGAGHSVRAAAQRGRSADANTKRANPDPVTLPSSSTEQDQQQHGTTTTSDDKRNAELALHPTGAGGS